MNKPEENEWVTGQITLEIDGNPLDMTMTVPAKPVKPQRMLPVFQQMTNSFVEIGVDKVESQGQTISCQKGCGACCRQPVPVAEIEAYQLAEVVGNLPEPRRTEIRERFERAFAHFAEIGWFERLSEAAQKTSKDQEQVVLDYFKEGIPCPFLIEESCSIHPDRPLACREYLVTSPAENCANPTAQTVKLIELPLKPSKSLMKVGQTRQITGINFIPLVLSLKWAEMNEDKFPEKTGEQWMADFFRNLTKSDIPGESGNG
ncbi:MAG: YkgJ family cysteine cluster protein [Pyrinomonadaceae bacterium]